jgi:hypothetical protein
MKLSCTRRQRAKDSVRDRIRLSKKLGCWGNTDLYARMQTALARKSKKKLLADAVGIAASQGIPEPGRLARRQRPVLIIWFCKHCPAQAQPITIDWQFESPDWPDDLDYEVAGDESDR